MMKINIYTEVKADAIVDIEENANAEENIEKNTKIYMNVCIYGNFFKKSETCRKASLAIGSILCFLMAIIILTSTTYGIYYAVFYSTHDMETGKCINDNSQLCKEKLKCYKKAGIPGCILITIAGLTVNLVVIAIFYGCWVCIRKIKKEVQISDKEEEYELSIKAEMMNID